MTGISGHRRTRSPVLEIRESRGHMSQIALPELRESIRCRRLAKANFTDDANNHGRMIFSNGALRGKKKKKTFLFARTALSISQFRVFFCVSFTETKIRIKCRETKLYYPLKICKCQFLLFSKIVYSQLLLGSNL